MKDHVAVPKKELEKLEKARVELYKYLETRLTKDEMYNLHSHTKQMWRVANRVKW